MGGDRRKTVICAILWFSDDILSSALVVAVSDNYENRIFPITLIVIVLYQIPLIRTRGPIGAVRWT